MNDFTLTNSEQKYPEQKYPIPKNEYPIPKNEYPGNHIYMDALANGLYTKSQIDDIHTELRTNRYCNPHSEAECSLLSNKEIKHARHLVLQHFNAIDYDIIFTAGATAAIKLVADCFPFEPGSDFVYLEDNHNSVVGIREVAPNAYSVKIPLFSVLDVLKMDEKNSLKNLDEKNSVKNLFCYPGESNFSGVKYPMDWATRAKHGMQNKKNWYVLIDGAALAASSSVDLTATPTDFFVCSFYKMFGYPTGVGALLVHKKSAHVLHKKYFGGGTVINITSTHTLLKKEISARYEDGTVNFLDIIAIKHGFRYFGNVRERSAYTMQITRILYDAMVRLTYEDGSPSTRIYGNWSLPSWSISQGPVVSFIPLDPCGRYTGFRKLTSYLLQDGFIVRSGGVCNPGSIISVFGLDENNMNTTCYDMDIGIIRVSLGPYNTVGDVYSFVFSLKKFFETSF